MRKKRKLMWWAACDGVAMSGPYRSQVEAWASLEAAQFDPPPSFVRPRQATFSTVHVPGARVWPSYTTPRVVTARKS